MTKANCVQALVSLSYHYFNSYVYMSKTLLLICEYTVVTIFTYKISRTLIFTFVLGGKPILPDYLPSQAARQGVVVSFSFVP